MKIGVISDTHIPEKAQKVPAAIIDAFKEVDMIIHVGDLVNIKVLDEFKKSCPRITAVFGNMDPQDVRNALAEKEILKIGRFKIGIMHGYGPPDKLIELLKKAFEKDKVDMVIFGHSHQPTSIEKDGILFFNPGSPTDTVFAPYNSFGIIEINDKIVPKIIKI